MPRIAPDSLQSFAQNLFRAAGISKSDATTVAASLVDANLRGMDSHGVMRIPYYIDAVKTGRLNPGVELKVVTETAASVVCHAGWGFGQVQAHRLLDLIIPKAQSLGVALGTMQATGHIGRVGEYAERAAALELALIAMVNTHGAAPRVSPPGGKRPRLGTNPLCVGVPTSQDPIVLDFGTSATAEGKVRVKRIAGEQCPTGWLLDSEGKPTTDPSTLYGDPPGSIRPMGGDQAYKGFGLSLVIDMLAGGLSGGLCTHPDPDPPVGNDVVFVLMNPATLGGSDHFLSQVNIAADHVKSCPTVDGVDKVILPGDPERNTHATRTREGIPLDEGNWTQLLKLGEDLGVTAPEIG